MGVYPDCGRLNDPPSERLAVALAIGAVSEAIGAFDGLPSACWHVERETLAVVRESFVDGLLAIDRSEREQEALQT